MDNILDDFRDGVADQSEDWELKNFIGDKSDFYLGAWRNQIDKVFVSFNIAALFFGIAWILHRRMYKYAIYIVLFIELETRALFYFLNYFGIYSFYASSINSLLFTILIGFLGNCLYRKHTFDSIEKIRAKNFNPESYELALIERGNPSWIYTGVGIPLLFLFYFVVTLLEDWYYGIF
jgi:hypothetical protein